MEAADGNYDDDDDGGVDDLSGSVPCMVMIAFLVIYQFQCHSQHAAGKLSCCNGLLPLTGECGYLQVWPQRAAESQSADRLWRLGIAWKLIMHSIITKSQS